MGVDLLIPRNRNDDAGARIGFVEIISVSLLASCRCYFLLFRGKPEIHGNVRVNFFLRPLPSKKEIDFKENLLSRTRRASRVVSSTRVTRINAIIDA